MGDKPELRGGGSRWCKVKGEMHLPDILFSPSFSFFFFSLPASFNPRLWGGPELCDWHYTQHRERQPNGPPISPFHLPFLIVSSLPPSFPLSNFQIISQLMRDKRQFSCLEGLRDTGRRLTQMVNQINTPSEEGDPRECSTHIFSFGMLCVCVCVIENAKMMYSIPANEYTTISLFSF